MQVRQCDCNTNSITSARDIGIDDVDEEGTEAVCKIERENAPFGCKPRISRGRLPPSLPFTLTRLKVWCLRTGSAIVRQATAAPSSDSQTLRYQHHPRPEPSIPISSSFLKFHSHCATSSPGLNVNFAPILPARPENALIKQQRVPPSSQPSSASTSVPSLHECCNNLNEHGIEIQPRIMGLSKSQRIAILLAIDGVFFFIELVAGMYPAEAKKRSFADKHI